MKKSVKFAALSIACFSLVACGSGKKKDSKEVTDTLETEKTVTEQTEVAMATDELEREPAVVDPSEAPEPDQKGSANMDELISQYEKVVTDFESLGKKLDGKNTDLSVFKELISMKSELTKMQKQLDGSRAEMSPEQTARLKKALGRFKSVSCDLSIAASKTIGSSVGITSDWKDVQEVMDALKGL